METLTLIISIAALVIAVIAYFKKTKTVVEYRSDLTLKTEQRIQNLEEGTKLHRSVLNNYELKSKKK